MLIASLSLLAGWSSLSFASDGIETYICEIAAAAKKLPAERRRLIDPIAAAVAKEFKSNRRAAIVFVCTHNSRRSQFSQAWAHTAAEHYGLRSIRFASGGTETTAANPRTVGALKRSGFDAKKTSAGENPVYVLTREGGRTPIRLFSKVYSDKSNPRRAFVAVMCCSDADEKCPVVRGAAARFPLHYVDPKISDGTPKETATYDERCRQIATEMFYLVSQIKRRIDETQE